jgi:hypothetical protein
MNIELAPEEYTKELTWDEAKLYCFALNIDGKVGWRIPTMAELHKMRSIALITTKKPIGNKRVYPKYWSSDQNLDHDDMVWVALPTMVDVHTTYNAKSDNTTLIRPVRDLQ